MTTKFNPYLNACIADPSSRCSFCQTIKRDGEQCETGTTDRCEFGKPCFTNIEITGEPARQLYEVLKERGVKIMDCCGEYVGTEKDDIICWGGSHHFRCTIGYSSATNEVTRPQSCQFE